jgi:hypothetical protein
MASWGIALTPSATSLTVGSVDLDDVDRLAEQQARQPRSIGAGALDADELELAETSQPREQPSVTGGGRRERFDAEEPAGVVERSGDVDVEVGVDPRGDSQWHSGHRHPFVGKRVGGTTPAGTTDRTAMGL